jgi:aspartyl-tRNA(Asn)/glutamyl-tRNA(Gln) amidotransferase subunit A
MTAADYVQLCQKRQDIINRADLISREFDAVIMPTVPMIAPAIAPLEADDRLYAKTNMLALRNCSIGNFLDRCAITLPCHRRGEAPVGLMVMGETMGDQRLLDIAASLEKVIGHIE